MRKTILLLALVMACKQTETSNTSTQTETMSTVVTTTSAAAPATTTAVATDTVTTGTTATTATLPTTTTTHAAKKEPTKAPATSTTATSAPAATTTTAPPPAAPPVSMTTAADLTHANVQTGATLYRTRGCTACHGTNGSGDTVMAKKNNIPDLHSAAVQSMSDAELTKVLSEGGRNPLSQSGHKSKHLTSDEETALIAWLRSLK